jgi:hypothetical protein
MLGRLQKYCGAPSQKYARLFRSAGAQGMKVDGQDTVTVWIKGETVQMIDQVGHSSCKLSAPSHLDLARAHLLQQPEGSASLF